MNENVCRNICYGVSLFKHPYQTGLRHIENDVILEV